MEDLNNNIDYSSYEFLNKKVTIKSMVDNKFLTESTVIEDNKKRHTIHVKTNDAELLKKAKSVYVNFLFEDGPIQFQGKVRKEFLNNAVEIAISKGTALQLRAHTRFDTKIPVNIDSVIIDNQKLILNVPFVAYIVDLSAAGIALEAPTLAFEKNDIVKIPLNVNGETLHYHYKIMRVSPLNVDSSSYGCQIVEV